jgi:hypothetical protein
VKTDEYIIFENKYFKGAAKVIYIDPNTTSILQTPFALVMIADVQTHSFIQSHPISESECTLLLSEDPEPFPINDDLEIEQVQDSISSFTSFIKSDSEYQGIGRIKEALECAAASYMSDLLAIPSIPPPSSQSTDPVRSTDSTPAPSIAAPNPVHSILSGTSPAAFLPSSSDDLDADMQCFEYFLNKIKESCEKSKEVDDETRRKNAESTIMELAKYLSLDDELEDEVDE